ncbi:MULTISPECIES: response regulator transcription factor [unclassified Paenibacillus]|uniref:response regulator transcription factor n=1 Tax=unclassified Paenibacillus TaxID=185978 RepID=UPI003635B668
MKKYRCLIVDDEDLIIRSLEQFFGFHTDRYELVGKAYSGKEAIDAALQLKPDIILTDIVMPGMNGIEMIDTLKGKLPGTVFIILTAYSDFDYAKQAIRMNVKDYIVKVPLSEDDIFQALDRAAQTLHEIEVKEAELRKLNTSRLENMYRFRRQIVTELLQGDIHPNQLSRHCDDLKVAPDLKEYCCVLIELDDYGGFKKRYDQADQSVIRYGMLNVAEETLGSRGSGFVCEVKDNLIFGIITLPFMESASRLNAQCMELGRELIDNIQKYMKQIVHVSFSLKHQSWDTMASAYRQALLQLQDAYYFAGEGQVFVSGLHLAAKPGEGEAQIKEWFQEIIRRLAPETKSEELKGILSRIAFQALEHRIPEQKMTGLINQFMGDIKQKVSVWKLLPEPLLIVQEDRIKFDGQWKRVIAYMDECLSQRQAPARSEISKAKQYIEENIALRLTLDEVAEYVSLVPSYFSTLFKKVENENFVDYVNRRKIEKAVALLKEKDYSNLQLSQLVGIQNERYFCTLFKHFFGLPPQKFRKTYL